MILDRCKSTTLTSGTGNLVLERGAISNYLNMADVISGGGTVLNTGPLPGFTYKLSYDTVVELWIGSLSVVDGEVRLTRDECVFPSTGGVASLPAGSKAVEFLPLSASYPAVSPYAASGGPGSAPNVRANGAVAIGGNAAAYETGAIVIGSEGESLGESVAVFALNAGGVVGDRTLAARGLVHGTALGEYQIARFWGENVNGRSLVKIIAQDPVSNVVTRYFFEVVFSLDRFNAPTPSVDVISIGAFLTATVTMAVNTDPPTWGSNDKQLTMTLSGVPNVQKVIIDTTFNVVS